MYVSAIARDEPGKGSWASSPWPFTARGSTTATRWSFPAPGNMMRFVIYEAMARRIPKEAIMSR